MQLISLNHLIINIDSNDKTYRIRAFEIDFDCIFNNLIINSCDAFRLAGVRQRLINISIDVDVDSVSIIYSDRGPGLSKDIQNPYDILTPTYTTKLDKDGKEVGTGLGMWLVSKTLEEYKSSIKLDPSYEGFKISMTIPHSYLQKDV